MSTPSSADAEALGDKPSPRPRADLSGAFGPPNRSGGLAGRLTRPARRATASDATPPQETEPSDLTSVEATGLDAGPEVEAGASAPDTDADDAPPAAIATEPFPPAAEQRASRPKRPTRNRASKSETAERSDSEGGTITSIVYLPGELLERLRSARAATGFTYTQLTLDALDATHQVLTDLITRATAPRARPAGSLFSGPSSAAATAQPKVQITLRPRSSDAAVIDQLATTHGVSRSQLVSLALDAHLQAN